MLLRERFPDGHFEVVNVAFTAINSHVILPMARECTTTQADLWLFYMGNNEMVGLLGAATVRCLTHQKGPVLRQALCVYQSRVAVRTIGRWSPS